MICRDNGRGFDPKFLANQTNGHWGLRGMAERAEKIGASFSCESPPVNGGIEVQVIVPARRAYQRPSRFQFFGRQTAAQKGRITS
jgi:nitrate/nitrite-specific signal transduction histidine kinase